MNSRGLAPQYSPAWYILSILLGIAVLLASCAGNPVVNTTRFDNSADPPAGDQSQPVIQPESSTSEFRAVVVQPQQPVETALHGISSLHSGNWPSALEGPRSSSWTKEDLLKFAFDHDLALPFNKVDNSSPPAATFNPTWDAQANPTTDDLAYAIYNLTLEGFELEPNQSIHLGWIDPPLNIADLWIGLGNVLESRWDWFAGPGDGILTIDSFAPYIGENGRTLVTIAVMGTEPATLEYLVIGDPELRATGEIFADLPPDESPPIDSAGVLPTSADISDECSPVSNQGQIAAGVAFAVSDGAFNQQLGKLYGDFGWDLTDPAFQASPKFHYIASGELQSLGCPWDGRDLPASVSFVQFYGMATEFNIPYEPLIWAKNNGFAGYDWCSDVWTPEALEDTGYLDIEGWISLPCTTPEGIESLKAVIANLGFVVVMRTNLDVAFDVYPGGEWIFTGPADGSQALCIVGYDDARQAFKVRNSWGSDWGDEGHIWISYSTFENAEAQVRCWYIWDDYDALTASHYCGEQAALAPPPAVSASDGAHKDRIELNWFNAVEATGYRIYRDTTDNLVATVGDVSSWDDTAVTNFNRHPYWLIATNDTDESSLSTPDTGYVEFDPVYPPEGLSASEDNPAGVLVAWTPPILGPTPVDGYKIYRDDAEIADVAFPGTSYLDTEAVEGPVYTYKASSYKSGYINSVFSNSDTGALPGDLLPPENLAATDGTEQEYVSVSWSHPSTGPTPAGYTIYRAGIEAGPYLQQAIVGYVTEWQDNTATPRNTVYWYKAKSNRSGFVDSVYSNADSGFMPDNLAAPTGLSATDGTSPDHVQVEWSHAGTGPDPTGYRIYRSTAELGTYTEIGSSGFPATTYDDATATPQTIFWYKVAAYGTGYSNSPFSNSDDGYRDYVMSPTGLAASDGTDPAKVEITWSHPTGDGETPEGYDVYRATTMGGVYTIVGTVGYITSWDDTTATPRGTTFWYKARGTVAGYQDSEFSNTDSGFMEPESWHENTVVSDNTIADAALLEVDSRAAIAFHNDELSKLEYVLSINSTGTAWEPRVNVDETVNDCGSYCSLAIIDGNPAIAYYDETDLDLKFRRADNATGSAWGGAIVTVYATGDVGSYSSLATVTGNPAISFSNQSTSNLMFVRSSTTTGSVWDAPVDADSGATGFEYTSLIQANGRPVISYYDVTNGDLAFVRASNNTGSAWGSPQALDSTDDVGSFTSLAIVNGNPAIAYRDITNQNLRYIRASNSDGTSWGSFVTISDSTDCGNYASLGIWDGNPAIAYARDDSGDKVGFVAASDPSGTGWGFPQNAATADAQCHASFAVIDGYPAICYVSGGDLKYAVYY